MRAGLLLLTLLPVLPAGADTLALRDGRFVERPSIDRNADSYVIHYEHSDVTVPAAMVLDYLKEGASGNYVPVTAEEKRRFAKGFVHWKGRWVKIAQRDRDLKKIRARRALYMRQLKERRFWRNHATVKTRRFIFNHTLPDEVFESYEALFETYYDFFTKYWGFRPSSKFGKVTINIYHTREYFEQVSGAPEGVLGWYRPDERDLHFYYDRADPRLTLDVMFHEGNHMLTHMIDRNMWYPWWIGEGMAEYFGASEWDPATRTMKLGGIQSGRLAVLLTQVKDGKLLKLEDLLETQGLGAIGYAWAWSFCHFLLHTPKYEKKIKRYYLAVARDRSFKKVPRFLTIRQLPPDEARRTLLRYLRVRKIEKLQKEWYDYIENVLGKAREGIDWGQAAETMVRFSEYAKARKYFKRALDAGSKEPYVHYGYAKLKLRQNMPGIALKYARKAAEFDPLHAGAWAIQGLALYATQEFAEGLRLLELAHEMAPDDSEIWFALEGTRQAEQKRKELEAGNG